MATISSINIASSTGTNWLKEAQSALLASENAGGLLGTLQNSKYANGSIKTYLANNQNAANALAQIAQNGNTEAGNLALQTAAANIQKAQQEKLDKLLNPPKQTNFNPPTTLDSFIYFADGGFLDTQNNILTTSTGDRIDTTTGQKYIEPGSLIQMANGAYLDTKNNILTLADGTKIDTITHLTITA